MSKPSFSRRQFLLTTAGAAGAVAAKSILLEPEPLLASAGAVPPSDSVRFGIVGVDMEGNPQLLVDFLSPQERKLSGLHRGTTGAAIRNRAGCAGIVPRSCDGPRLADLILRDLGVIPSREAMLNLEKVTPQATSAEDRAARQTRLLASVIAERHRVFGIELPDDMKAAIEQGDAAEAEMPRRSLRA
jgi:hypothetical protein